MVRCMMRASDVYYRLQGAERAWYTGAGIMIIQQGEGAGSRGIVRRSSRWRKHQANATTRPPLPFHRELGGASETTRGARGRVGGGSPAALVMELRPSAVTIPRVAPVAVIAGTDVLELAARLPPLRLRFLITSVLRDRGRVTPWSFC